ncbi:phosphoglycerate kinase [Candidatus Saccharibacteria bacterium]|nr:phosphoglycerate kinase [Candidatus Saccharibacteria bacterium]
MFNKKTIKDIDVSGKVILLRADYNVPMEDGDIADDLRIRASLPTIQYLLDHGADKIVIISHLGRPNGREEKYSLLPVAKRLKKLLPDNEVFFNYDVAGEEVKKTMANLPKGSIFLLENLRFWPEEKWNDVNFAKEIAEATKADVFVQDGFGVVHRAHTSTDAITKILPSVAGLLLEKEITTLSKILSNPTHPFYVIIGGAKVEDKQPLIEKFTDIADEIWVGGKIAADGYQADNDKIHVITDFKEDSAGIKSDISDSAGDELAKIITDNAATVLWNGTLGKVEDPDFARNSKIIAEAIGKKANLTSVICGGDTTAFVEGLMKDDPDLHYTLLSTGGGATLSFLSGEPLPGYDELEAATVC